MVVRILKDAVGPQGVREYYVLVRVRDKEILLTEEELRHLAVCYNAIQDEKTK